MESVNLEQIIKQYVNLGPVSATGFQQCLCKVCNDHGEKGLRAGFNFSNNQVGYHCFNCKHDARYTPGSSLSNDMVILLSAFGVPEEKYKTIAFFDIKNGVKTTKTSLPTAYDPPTIELPKHFYKLSDADPDDKWTIIAENYLEERGVNPTEYPYMLSTGEGEYGKKWKARIIMPFYKDGNLIYYTGRALVPSIKRYETPACTKTNVLYGYDKLFIDRNLPLFVVEGFFDAFLVNGIALLGNELTTGHKHWLNLSQRKKVYIPDKSGDGWEIALQCIKEGWSIATPDIGNNVKDINDAVLKYGKLYVTTTLMQNISDGKTAELKLQHYCTDYGKTKIKFKKKVKNG
jgi:DNA primase